MVFIKKGLKRFFQFLKYSSENNFILFIFFVALVFSVFHNLFNSYFEADEWFHFTHYYPLLKENYGEILAITKSVTDTVALSEGQHVVPIGEEIFFLSAKFFGINFVPYAFMSVFLHAINSFLVFLFIRELLNNKKLRIKNTIIAITGGIFFALSAIPMHAVTWAAFYGQNVLSVTFFLLCLLSFKVAVRVKSKKYLILSSIFFLLDLLTKETAVVLFLILPLIYFLEKGSFPPKYIAKIFSIPFVFFLFFRFLIPAAYFWINNLIGTGLPLAGQITSSQIVQKGTDLSLIIYRIITFPLSMISQVFIPAATILSTMKIITPLIYYQYPGEPEVRGVYRQFFTNGPGNNLLFYLISLGLIILIITFIVNYFRKKREAEAKACLIGFAIITVGALPLVLNVLYLPWWGTEYFDARHYYMPSVGASILFPFLLLAIGELIAKAFKIVRIHIPHYFIVLVLFILWLVNNMNVFNTSMRTIVDLTGYPRREIITQMKRHLPSLPDKAVFYAETDGGGAYGTILPFQTSFPQILTIVYYDKNPLPDSFFDKFVLDAKPQGYKYADGRGFGFYNSKRTLSEALLTNDFSVNDIYGFYFNSKETRLDDITKSVRAEMEDYLKNAKDDQTWVTFQDSIAKISFRSPPSTQVEEKISEVTDPKIVKTYTLTDPRFSAELNIVSVAPAFDLSEMETVVNERAGAKRIYFDAYHFNDAVVVTSSAQAKYFVKFPDKLAKLVVLMNGTSQDSVFEKIMGSVVISE